VLALQPQGLGVRNGNALRRSFCRHGDIVLPLNGVRINQEFVFPRQGIVENSHFLIAHNDQFLIFEGMKPGNEYMRFKAGGKIQMRCGDVGDFFMQIVAAGCQHVFRLFSGQGEDHGDIMRRERPENIFLPADLAQVQAVRINVVDPSQFSVGGNLFEPDKRRVVLKKMADHQNQIPVCRQFDQLFRVFLRERHRFFNKNMLARQ